MTAAEQYVLKDTQNYIADMLRVVPINMSDIFCRVFISNRIFGFLEGRYYTNTAPGVVGYIKDKLIELVDYEG